MPELTFLLPLICIHTLLMAPPKKRTSALMQGSPLWIEKADTPQELRKFSIEHYNLLFSRISNFLLQNNILFLIKNCPKPKSKPCGEPCMYLPPGWCGKGTFIYILFMAINLHTISVFEIRAGYRTCAATWIPWPDIFLL